MYSQGELGTLKKAYDLFNIAYDAPAADIKRRYRALIKQWHPDRWTGDPDKKEQAGQMMRAINAAYDLIEHAPLQHQDIKDELLYDTYEKEETRSGTAYEQGQRRAARRHATRRRHERVHEATAFRKRSAARFRFFVGALCGLGPLAALYIYGIRGEVLLMWGIGLVLICGYAYRSHNVLEDD